MSKRQFKSQASSGRVEGGFGGFGSAGFGSTQSSTLSYIQEAPDYSTIGDANIVVAFKNLSKRDAITKAKALEDVLAYVASSGAEIDDGVLDAWVRLFPRLSIDSARRVRQLSHSLNGQICSKCGKRIAKHLPRIAGAWLAGTYDSDRAAANSALAALNLVFPSKDKIDGLQKTFHRSILEYCRDAILRETVQTLTDERTVSPDDAQATYARVVATSITVVSKLLNELPMEETVKQQDLYSEVFESAKLWDFVTHSDAGLRRATNRLVQALLLKQPEEVGRNAKAISHAYVYKGLTADQTGSAVEFVQTLYALTLARPTIWTDDYSGMKPPMSRLRHLLKHGSQNGANKFWESLSTLSSKLPKTVLPSSSDEAAELLLALREGVTKRDERFSSSAAWAAYFTLANVLSENLDDQNREKILDAFVLPVIRQYLQPSPDTAEWSTAAGKAANIVSQAVIIQQLHAPLEREWPSLADGLVATARMSQPQQSKDFEKSQTHVASTGERWADLQRELFESKVALPESLMRKLVVVNGKIVEQCIELLTARDGKPFGAAAIIEALLRSCGPFLLVDSGFKTVLRDFLQGYASGLALSPSRRYIVRIIFAVRSEPYFAAVFKEMLQNVVLSEEQEAAEASQTLQDILPANTPREAVDAARTSVELQNFVQGHISAQSDNTSVTLVSHLMKLGVVSEAVTQSILSSLVQSLSIGEHPKDALDKLEILYASNSSAMKGYAANEAGSMRQLLPSLLQLEASTDDEIAEHAAKLSLRMSSVVNGIGNEARYSMLIQNLEDVSQSSLSMDALHELTIRLLGQERKIDAPAEVLPNTDVWMSALRAVVRSPPVSLALLSPLAGATHLVSSQASTENGPVHVDKEGLSQALRMAMYVSRLLTETNLFESLDELGSTKQDVMALLYITVLLAEDNVSVHCANALWHPKSNADVEGAVLDFVTEANAVLARYWQPMVPTIIVTSPANETSSSEYARFQIALEKTAAAEVHDSPLTYYSSLALCKLQTNLFELHGHNAEQVKSSEASLRHIRSDKHSLKTIAAIVGLQHPLASTQTITRYCNELAADLTDLDIPTQEGKSLEKLVLLNSILYTQEDVVATIAKQRLIFLAKRLITALDEDTSFAVKAELCKALNVLLPGMSDMYGEHWALVSTFIATLWSSADCNANRGAHPEDLELLEHASFRLYATLRKLAKSEESNEDLVEALRADEGKVHDGLIKLLKSAEGDFDEDNQPLMITHELLARQISSLPRKIVTDTDELYPLLYTPSRSIQQAAFDLLHHHIPAAQEQISFDAALDNKTARLPDELLSLILETPTLDTLADASFDRSMPMQLQGYLYSWRLLFDHFTNSSYKVKGDYIEQLKDGVYLPGLLSLTFDFLGHSRGKPVDASKFDILEYTADSETSPERDVQWLLIHLYHLALTHLPSLVRNYYLDIRSRQTSQAIESWTAKYISPRIMTASLEAVAEWAEKSVKDDPEYEKMTVKVGMKSKEINASYEVDEQIMAIKVVLPEAYPLASARVEGVNRVAVKEEKWQSWLRNCQGVITFSVSQILKINAQMHADNAAQNGAITDGLHAWRRNVTAALLNKADCAICMSRKLSHAPSMSLRHMLTLSPIRLKWSASTSSSQRRNARPVATSSTPAACSNGSSHRTPVCVRFAGMHSTSIERVCSVANVHTTSIHDLVAFEKGSQVRRQQ